MKSPWISGLRSVSLTVPDLAAAETFYTQTWGLTVADRSWGTIYFRGSGNDHHLLAPITTNKQFQKNPAFSNPKTQPTKATNRVLNVLSLNKTTNKL